MADGAPPTDSAAAVDIAAPADTAAPPTDAAGDAAAVDHGGAAEAPAQTADTLGENQAPSGQAAEPIPAEPDPAVVIASLRAALTQEQERRQAVETELERLKEETSTPALADTDDPAAELAAARSQITELREALGEERVERERMADELRALQQQPEHAAPPEGSSDNAEVQARIESLRAEKAAIVESFNRSLAASQRRTAELEQQLALTQAAAAGAAAAAPAPAAAAPTDGETTALRAENTALRTRLDEEHRRTEDLGAKLRVATRITDLIFKMQAQQAQAQPIPRH